MLGQIVCAMAQSFILCIPTRLAAQWFGPNEVATATSIGVFSNQLGIAIGCLIPPKVVHMNDSIEYILMRFYYLQIPTAVLAFISFLLAFCNFNF
jgi:MFS transporter, FLVCR family, feline leukemia virus subgroup C receptor-related protein